MKPKMATLKPRIPTLDTRQGSSVTIERIRGYALTKIRERIALMAGYQCQRCNRVVVHGVVDHIMPLHLGGQETDANRQWLCLPCHDLKSADEEKGRNEAGGAGQISGGDRAK